MTALTFGPSVGAPLKASTAAHGAPAVVAQSAATPVPTEAAHRRRASTWSRPVPSRRPSALSGTRNRKRASRSDRRLLTVLPAVAPFPQISGCTRAGRFASGPFFGRAEAPVARFGGRRRRLPAIRLRRAGFTQRAPSPRDIGEEPRATAGFDAFRRCVAYSARDSTPCRTPRCEHVEDEVDSHSGIASRPVRGSSRRCTRPRWECQRREVTALGPRNCCGISRHHHVVREVRNDGWPSVDSSIEHREDCAARRMEDHVVDTIVAVDDRRLVALGDVVGSHSMSRPSPESGRPPPA